MLSLRLPFLIQIDARFSSRLSRYNLASHLDQQGSSEKEFQRVDLLTDRRWRHAQFLGRAGNAASPHGCVKHADRAKWKH